MPSKTRRSATCEGGPYLPHLPRPPDTIDGMRLLAVIVLAILVTACAPRRLATVSEPAPSPPDLEGLIRVGCYRCLESAFAGARARGRQDLAFETAALLTLRSKELGLPFEGWLDRARELTAVDPALRVYVDIVGAIPSDPLSGNRDPLVEVQGRMQARMSMTSWRDALRDGPGSALFRAYVDVALVCSFGTLDVDERSFSGPIDPVAETPLYQYRIGLCGVTPRDRLGSLRAAHPELVDIDYALGRYEVEDQVSPDPEAGLRRLESAWAAFPDSPAISTTIGNVHRAWEDWDQAHAAYDAALVKSPNHPEAMVGRITSLSRLSRSQEAVAAATDLLEGGRGRRGEAYYWRAWNYLSLGEHDLARSDADRAKALMVNAPILVLSGTIDWRLRKLRNAEDDFQQALTMDFGECEAAFDLAVVRDELGKQVEAIAAFQQAQRCYDLSRTLRREAIAKIHAGPGSETMKARAAAIHERVLAELADRYQEVLRALDVLQKVTGAKSIP
jgi:tetratricopeptide (TPR) repeat protein